jgi:hypothetical protein
VKHRLKVVENRVLRRIFGRKWEEMAEDWRRLNSEELCKFYASPNIVQVIKLRRMRWTEHVGHMGEMRSACSNFDGEREGKRPLGRHRLRWENNIRMDFMEREWGGVDWIHLAQDRDKWRALVNTVMNFGFSKRRGNS